MRAYTTYIDLPGTTELEDVERLLTFIRGQANAELLVEPFRIRVIWEAEDDWDLRGLVEEIRIELESWDIQIEIKKEDVFDI